MRNSDRQTANPLLIRFFNGQKRLCICKVIQSERKITKKADFQTLAESRDLEELMTRIKIPFMDRQCRCPKTIRFKGIESALRGHLADVHYSIAKTAGDSAS